MKLTRFFGIIAVFCIAIAIAMFTDLPLYKAYKAGDIKDFNEVEAGGLQNGDLVRGTADMNFGACAEEYSTTFGIRTSKKSSKLYYVLWMDNNQLILYETANADEFDTLDKQAEETSVFLDSQDDAAESGDDADIILPNTTLEIEGSVMSIPSSIEGYFREWYDDDQSFDENTEAVMIRKRDFSKLSWIPYIGIAAGAAGVVMLVLTIVFFVKAKRAQRYGY